MNGAWVLPASAEHKRLFLELSETVRTHRGHASILLGADIAADGADVKDKFVSDRAREYEEFHDRCEAFQAEIAKERKLRKFTFVELEEIDDDFAKLSAWLQKIAARDFFPNDAKRKAEKTLKQCDAARGVFAIAVYAAEGIDAKVPKDT